MYGHKYNEETEPGKNLENILQKIKFFKNFHLDVILNAIEFTKSLS